MQNIIYLFSDLIVKTLYITTSTLFGIQNGWIVCFFCVYTCLNSWHNCFLDRGLKRVQNPIFIWEPVNSFSQIWLCRKCDWTIISSASSGQTVEIVSVNQPGHSEARLNRSRAECWWIPMRKEQGCVMMSLGLVVGLCCISIPGPNLRKFRHSWNFECVSPHWEGQCVCVFNVICIAAYQLLIEMLTILGTGWVPFWFRDTLCNQSAFLSCSKPR